MKFGLKDFFDIVLKGESRTYNDHNWYVCSGSGCLKMYIEGRSSNHYPLLKKPLSKYTIKEVMDFQSKPRTKNIGQLWATGRYQIIPKTLKNTYPKAGLKETDVYNQENQDKMALALLKGRSAIRNYIYGFVPDTKENRQKAALEMAKEWSSIGVPYKVEGMYKIVDKNESYYSGRGDKASVDTEEVQLALQQLRKGLGGKTEYIKEEVSNAIKNPNYKPLLLTSLLVLAIGGSFLAVYLAKKYFKK